MLPRIDVSTRNLTIVHFDELSLWFSYQTMIAFENKGRRYVIQNYWGNTTRRHLNTVDMEDGPRLTSEEFELAWNELKLNI